MKMGTHIMTQPNLTALELNKFQKKFKNSKNTKT